MDEPSVLKLAKILWDYHFLNLSLQQSDCILVMGSHDTKVAERGAELFHEGWAPLIVVSGQRGMLTMAWTKTEADEFAEVLMRHGVPADKILKENEATNTQENVTLTKKLLESKGFHINSVIIVQKPYMERRALATFQRNWPEAKGIVASPRLSFDEYVNIRGLKQLTESLVGDTQRLKIYGEKGYLVLQKIPSKVWNAYKQLVKAGYDRYLC